MPAPSDFAASAGSVTWDRAYGEDLIGAAVRAQLASLGERLVFEDANGVHERGALLSLTWPQLAALGPPRELATRGELQRLHLFAGQALRRRVTHDLSSRTANSMSHKSP